jgi:hypothetical protein
MYQMLLGRLITDDQLGSWSLDEEASLIRAMETQDERGKTPCNTPSFWKQVSQMLGQT